MKLFKRWPYGCALLTLLWSVAANVLAEPLQLAQAERLAVRQEPGMVAHQLRAQALREEALAVSDWPDPELIAAMANLPLDSFDRERDPITQLQLGVRQRLPRAGELQALSEDFQARSSAMDAQAEWRRLQVLRQLRQSWLDWVYQYQRGQLWRRVAATDEERLAASLSAYSNGLTSLAELQQARVRPLNDREQILQAEQAAAAAEALVWQWLPALGETIVEQTAPPGPPTSPARFSASQLATEWPQWPEPPAVETLIAALPQHPRLRILQAQASAAEAQIAVAESRYHPALTIEAGYGLRSGSDPFGRSRSDLGTLRVTLDLPWFGGKRLDARLRAARDQEAAVTGETLALQRQWAAAIRAEAQRYQHLQQRLDLYTHDLLPLRQQQSAAAGEAYRSADGSILDYLSSQREALQSRLLALEVRYQQALSRIELAYLGTEEFLP
ncbi:MAG: hypothetical protein Tsb002_22160 [Wenzhouxiangellaceae bacterium]